MNNATPRYLMALSLIWLIFIVLPIGNRGLWNPDEPRYTQVAWEMVQADTYLIPLLDGELYHHKPPLFFWLTILLSKITAFECASRWVSALAALGTILLTFHLGKRAENETTGWIAALLLMTCGLYAQLMNNGNIDITYTFFITLSCWFYIKWTASRKVRLIIAAYSVVGLAVLTKGPAALIICWLIFSAHTLFSRSRGEKVALAHLWWGPLVAIGIVSVWLIPACLAGGTAYAHMILIEQNIGRAVNTFAHAKPWYYFIVNFPVLSLPWFLLFIGILPTLRQTLKTRSHPLLFYLIWFTVVVIFFSCMSGKRGRYLLPAYPAFCIMIGHAASRWQDGHRHNLFLWVIGIVMAIIVTMLLLFPILEEPLANHIAVLHELGPALEHWRIWVMSAFGLCGFLLLAKTLMHLLKKQNRIACVHTAFSILAATAMVQTYYIPRIEPVKSARIAAQRLKLLMSPADTVAFLNKRLDNGWNFYLNRPWIPVFTLEDISGSSAAPTFIITRSRQVGIDALVEQYNYKQAFVQTIGSKKYTVLKHVNTATEIAGGQLLPQFSFAVLADPRKYKDTWKNALLQIRDMAATPEPAFDAAEFMVVVGDMDPLTERYRDYRHVFAGTHRPPFLPVIGNHDLDMAEKNILFAQDSLIPALPHAVRRQSDACDYYLDHLNTRVIVVDAYSELGRSGVILPHGRQWVAQVIEAAPESIEHIFVCFHEPAFPRHRHINESFDADPKNRNEFWDMLVAHKNKVRAVFVGHTHHYSRMRILDPRAPGASNPAAFPDENGGIYQIDAGAAGQGEKSTVIQVRIAGPNVYFRVLQAKTGKSRSFRIVDEWEIAPNTSNSNTVALKTGHGS